MEPWKTCGQVVADLQHFDKDPDLSENSDQDPHLSEKMDTDPHLFKILSPGTTVNYLRAQPNNHWSLEEKNSRKKGITAVLFWIFMCYIKHCFICRPSYYTVSEDAGTEPKTDATLALTVERSNHPVRSHTHPKN